MLEINRKKCIYCGGCTSVCPVGALELKGEVLTINHEKCIKCGRCVALCPAGALKLGE